jgi:hypothetical protein
VAGCTGERGHLQSTTIAVTTTDTEHSAVINPLSNKEAVTCSPNIPTRPSITF